MFKINVVQLNFLLIIGQARVCNACCH